MILCSAFVAALSYIPATAVASPCNVQDSAISLQRHTLSDAIAPDLSLDFEGDVTPGRLVLGDGSEKPVFVPGINGQAIKLRGKSAILVEKEIDPIVSSRFTATAWVRRQPDKNSGWIMNSGDIVGLPSLSIYNEKLQARGGRDNVISDGTGGAIPALTWTFVAAVWDYEAAKMWLRVGDWCKEYSDLRMDAASGDVLDQPGFAGENGDIGQFVTFGASDPLRFGRPAIGIALDNVRLFRHALTASQLNALADRTQRETAVEERVPSDCDVRTQVGCGPGKKCQVFASSSGDGYETSCVADGFLSSGARCIVKRDGLDDCVAGTYCEDAICRATCDGPEGPYVEACAGGSAGPVVTPLDCDPFANQGCPPNNKCQILGPDGAGGILTGCAGDGSVAEGGECQVGVGTEYVDDCAGGTYCAFGRCRRPCDGMSTAVCAPGGNCTLLIDIGDGKCAGTSAILLGAESQ